VAVSPLGAFLGLLLIFFAPGFFLLQALFPRRRYFGPFHKAAVGVLSVALSAAITVLVGTILGFLPGGPDGRGWFQGSQTGAPIIELTLGGLSVIFFGIAWARGAFPLLRGARDVETMPERGEPEEVTMLRDMRLEEERLRQEAARVRKRASQSRDVGVQSALNDAASDLDQERKGVATRARDVERAAGERRYGMSAPKKEAWRARRDR